MTKTVDSTGTCQVVDLAEFRAARELRRAIQAPADADVPQQLALLPDALDPGRRALVRQVPHRQRMLAHLESVSAGSAAPVV